MLSKPGPAQEMPMIRCRLSWILIFFRNICGTSRPRAVQTGTRTLDWSKHTHTMHPSSIVQCPKMIDALGRAQVMPMNDYLGFEKKKKKNTLKNR
jgi:hypothetical protein